MPRRKIAVITARADDSEQRTILTGITETAFALDTDVVVFSNIYNHWISDELLNYENHIYDFFQPEQFDGVIITAESFLHLSVLDDVFGRIRTAAIPAVIIDGSAEGFQSITSDDEAALKEITEHLITVHGLSQIDILTGPAHIPVSHTRVAGCRQAFEAHGIPFDTNHVYYGDFWHDSGEALAKRYLNGELPLPQAVICTNDYMAYGLCDALTAAGIAIPAQLTVTGYDYTEGRIYYYPVLTTYRRNRQLLGARAAAQLLSPDKNISAQAARLICGNTCSCGVNTAQLNEEIRAVRIGQFHSAMNSAAQFSNRLTLCRTIAEYTSVLAEYFYLLHGADRLYLCLDKAWNHAAYEGDTFLCCMVNGAEASDTPQHFKREILLPALYEERETPMVYYFSPLCFQMRLFGYTALAYSQPQCYDFSFRDWNKTVVNTLEFLRMKNDIHYLTQCQRVSSLYDSLTGFYHLREFRKIIETADAELAANCYLQAIKLSFSADGEYLYGENYRSDIISECAKAVKQAAGRHEICCRTADDLFLILCKAKDGALFSDKLKVMMHHAVCGKYEEDQVIIAYAEHSGTIDSATVDAICRTAEGIAADKRKEIAQRKQQPHYRAFYELRKNMLASPKHAPSSDDICKMLCLSKGYFRLTYKKCFCTSYVHDCIHARIMLACYLLCTTAMSVYAIALECGYTDEKYFARQFRQSVGCSPVQYRERHC